MEQEISKIQSRISTQLTAVFVISVTVFASDMNYNQIKMIELPIRDGCGLGHCGTQETTMTHIFETQQFFFFFFVKER